MPLTDLKTVVRKHLRSCDGPDVLKIPLSARASRQPRYALRIDVTLEGVDAKIGRAIHHAAELRALLVSVLAPDQYQFTFDSEPQDGENVYRVYGVPDIDLKWTLIIGDCINNLRATLDHSAWQLVALDRKTPTC